MTPCAPSKLRGRQDSQEGKEGNYGPSHALDARKKVTKFKLVQTLKLNHTAQAEPIILVQQQFGLRSKDKDKLTGAYCIKDKTKSSGSKSKAREEAHVQDKRKDMLHL
jgi:hypothetical protein